MSRGWSPVDVSVVIPTRNGGQRLLQVFEALRAQETSLSTEVVIIDSGSTDRTVEAARDHGFRVLAVDPREFNHGETRDRAIARSRGRCIALLVQDALPVGSTWLDRLAAPLLDDPEAAGAFSRQLPVPGGNPILDQRLAGWIAGKDEPRRSQLGAGPGWEELTPFQRLELVAFDNVSSCVRRSCWTTRHFGRRPFGEDLAWATWAIRRGFALRFHPDSVVEHSHDRSAWHETRRIYCDHRNLNDLLGLTTVPTLEAAWRGQRAARNHYRQLLAGAGLSAAELRRRQSWARAYAVGEVLAQWLAPKVNHSGPGGLLAWLDERIRRGI